MAFLFNMKNIFKVLEKGWKFIVKQVLTKIGETPKKYIKEKVEEGGGIEIWRDKTESRLQKLNF